MFITFLLQFSVISGNFLVFQFLHIFTELWVFKENAFDDAENYETIDKVVPPEVPKKNEAEGED